MSQDFAQELKTAMTRLPFITGDLPGIGGIIKAEPEHFHVEEILPYEPCGQGEHLYVKLRRQGWNTADVGRALAKPFGLKNSDVGWGGRKDKNAVTTQTFSLCLPMHLQMETVESTLKDLPFELLDLKRHGNKIKTGHVAANRFRIILSQIAPHALASAEAIAEKVRRFGLPNFYGEQRFGIDLRNIDRSMAIVSRGKARGRKEGFMVSVLQSALFNIWLTQRIERDEFQKVILGDIAKKTDTGGMFTIEDLDEAQQRFEAKSIIFTGPIYGHKMKNAGGQANAYEKALLKSLGLTLGDFKPLRAPGSRRAGIIHIDDLTLKHHEKGIEFTFTLPSGAYATTLLREFTRPGVRVPS